MKVAVYHLRRSRLKLFKAELEQVSTEVLPFVCPQAGWWKALLPDRVPDTCHLPTRR